MCLGIILVVLLLFSLFWKLITYLPLPSLLWHPILSLFHLTQSAVLLSMQRDIKADFKLLQEVNKASIEP